MWCDLLSTEPKNKAMKHTKGPWKIYERTNWYDVLTDNNDDRICSIDRMDELLSLADAKLIAAAPELLETIKEIFEEINLADTSLKLYKQTAQTIKKATE